ncbi:putative carboxylesterase 11 [Hibiscus syriacus]|uniref:Carboxylesterase 11 n=1 Tax=Hibiscus syriacus TaxID=106335 RepID=A0A6A3A6Z8_HIBSY|nr:probable carboxylesterase 16 [Hibiscus syriacus]KAE8698932.1 putative carboxylesterase 11 [Hibiscus syriacus]
MPSLPVKLYSIFFKLQQRYALHNIARAPIDGADPFGVTSRRAESTAASNPSFTDGIATKDIHIDPFSSLCIRIFLPDTVVHDPTIYEDRSKDCAFVYSGYCPQPGTKHKKLPVALQFHGGAFIGGSNDSVRNDLFCRRIAKLCDVIVVAVGYRLAPESRYPAAFDDGLKVLNWLVKEANLAECGKWMGNGRRRMDAHVFDGFGASMAEPWLAAHGDPSRCVLLGVSCGANIADYVARKVVEAGKLLDPVKVVAQVLMYPFFIGSSPTASEIKLANSYVYDKSTCLRAWKLFLPEKKFNLDHPAANPLIPGREPPLKFMPPTLTVVAEQDWMRDRAIAYSEELRKVNIDAPLLEYKDAVHEFATLEVLLQTPQAQACAEDIAIWVKKYISLRGHEFSY